MTQTSTPITGVNLSDADWRDLFGDEPGVIGDLDGSAYKVTLPTDSDVAQIGSATQPSLSRVAGFSHRIPAGAPEGVTIPAAVTSDRTDIVAVRYDPANSGAPGPCRLVRIAGTSAGLPAYDASPPGVEDMPVVAITRKPGQALSQATVKYLFPRLALPLDVPPDAPLPLSSPLGTVARQGPNTYRRELGNASVPTWVPFGEQRIATMADRPTSGLVVGQRVRPADRPTASYVWNGRIWVQDGLVETFTPAEVPNGAYVTEQRGNFVGNVNNGGQGGINIPLIFAFSNKPLYARFVAGDSANGLRGAVPNRGVTTASTIHAQAFRDDGWVPGGAQIRVLWTAVGYNT